MCGHPAANPLAGIMNGDCIMSICNGLPEWVQLDPSLTENACKLLSSTGCFVVDKLVWLCSVLGFNQVSLVLILKAYGAFVHLLFSFCELP